MIAYYLRINGKLDKNLKEGEYNVEKFGDVDEDDPSIHIR